jgi:monoterpene epsilon-lactone hydrolase
MPSWQARLAAAYVRATIRRRDWGDERALALRARRLFGLPRVLAPLAALGVRRTRVREEGPHGPLRGEWHAPSDTSGAAREGVLLYVHGGGFVACSPARHLPLTRALARRTGRRVFSVDYRLAPETRFPAALDDVAAAYRWLHATGAGGGRVAVVGDSAGGGLALSLALRARDEGWPAPACVVAFSPWTDLTGGGASVRANDGRDAMFRPENLRAFAAAYLGPGRARDAAHPLASPAFAPLHGLPPLLLHVGSTELLLDDARRVHEGVRAAGGASTLVVLDDVMHGAQLLAGYVPEATRSVRDVGAFIAAHLDTTV